MGRALNTVDTDNAHHETDEANERHKTNNTNEHEKPNNQIDEHDNVNTLNKEATGSESTGSKRGHRPTIPQPTTVSYLHYDLKSYS